jgi:hypothetical protein
MRNCSKCRKADRAEVDPESECKCGAVSKGHEDHHELCPRLIHEVRPYYVRVNPKELTPSGKLSTYYSNQGWELKQDGGRYYRSIEMCRQCIRDHEDALSRKQDYLKACKTAKGLDERTYAQMLASQGS